jgi:hypothetical protein
MEGVLKELSLKDLKGSCVYAIGIGRLLGADDVALMVRLGSFVLTQHCWLHAGKTRYGGQQLHVRTVARAMTTSGDVLVVILVTANLHIGARICSH